MLDGIVADIYIFHFCNDLNDTEIPCETYREALTMLKLLSGEKINTRSRMVISARAQSGMWLRVDVLGI